MECTFLSLIACFSWSGLYLDATTEYIDSRDRRYTESYYGESLNVFNAGTGQEYLQRNVVRELSSPEREVSNPYGRASLGYEIDIRSLRIDVSAFYQESLKTSDRGEAGASLKVRWFPFRR